MTEPTPADLIDTAIADVKTMQDELDRERKRSRLALYYLNSAIYGGPVARADAERWLAKTKREDAAGLASELNEITGTEAFKAGTTP